MICCHKFPLRPSPVRHGLLALAAMLVIGVAPAARGQTPDAAPTSSSATPPQAAAPAIGGPPASAPAAPSAAPAGAADPAASPSAGTPSTETPPVTGQPAQTTAPEGGAPGAANPALPHDLSPWAMFRNADIVVKAVMSLLAVASVATWTIFIAKRLQLASARFRAVRAVREVLRATSLRDLDKARQTGPLKAGPVAALVHAAAHERERSNSLPADGIKERAAIALGRIEARAARTMTRGTGLVASIGSTAPFVGLFGTVWGIMNSFVGISQAHTTNLAVVAPGIAEALLATAIGLVAAIPAVIIYNGLARAIAGYKAVLSDASAEIMRHLSRDLDRQFGPAE